MKSAQSIQRWCCGVEYHGGQLSGWQFQGHHTNTVQYELEHALSQVGAEQIQVHGSGRTDKGVHALEQVCHFDSSAARTAYAWRQGANRHLPAGIRIRWVQAVPSNFHARYNALFRDYLYIIEQSQVRSAIWGSQVMHCRANLDVAAMTNAAEVLQGEHDFSTFRAAACQSKHAMRYLFECDVWQAQSYVGIAIRGNAFLQHMVRNIVGSLVLVGAAERPIDWLAQILEQKNRELAGPTAPAQGLYLQRVHYRESFELPTQLLTPMNLFASQLTSWPKYYPNFDFRGR